KLIFEMLDSAVNEVNSSPKLVSSIDQFEVSGIFDALQERGDVPVVDLVSREYAYLPFFRFQPRTPNIHKLMAADPGFFVAIVRDAFKPASKELPPPSDEIRQRGRAAYQLLSEMNVVPGFEGPIADPAHLAHWAKEVARLSAEEDREIIGEQSIGRI